MPNSEQPAAPPPETPNPAPGQPPQPPAPRVERRNRLRLSMVWLVPLLAVLVGLGLGVRHVVETGPSIEIEFATAEGLEPNKTEVRYKEVIVGKVTRVTLARDRAKVLVNVQLDKSAGNMAVSDSRFWVVKPRVGTGGVSGLTTLLSGSYIGVDAGVSVDEQKHFVGLEAPPFVLHNEPGRSFVLNASDLGSLDIGSPVYYRRTRVGRVVGYALDPKLDVLTVQVFIESPNENLVTTQSRFWNASGVDLALNASGLTLNTQSLASVVAGGVAFANASGKPSDAKPAAQGTRFNLFGDSRTALAPPDGPPVRVRMEFAQNTRGLTVGAPIDVLGVEIGHVAALTLQHDPVKSRFSVEVIADLYPRRLGVHGQPGMPDDDKQLMKLMVDRGLRGQLRSGNLITGQQLIALDFQTNQAGSFDVNADIPTFPVMPNEFGSLQPQLLQIVKRISAIKFDEIGEGVLQTLHTANHAIEQLTPQAQQALTDVHATLQHAQQTLDSAQQSLQSFDRNVTGDDAPLQRNANQTMDELQKASKALRVLADYLQKHPESLLRGKPGDVPLADPYTKP